MPLGLFERRAGPPGRCILGQAVAAQGRKTQLTGGSGAVGGGCYGLDGLDHSICPLFPSSQLLLGLNYYAGGTEGWEENPQLAFLHMERAAQVMTRSSRSSHPYLPSSSRRRNSPMPSTSFPTCTSTDPAPRQTPLKPRCGWSVQRRTGMPRGRGNWEFGGSSRPQLHC